MNVRRATLADFEAVASLVHQYYTEYDIWQRDDDAALRAYLETQLGFFLAFVEGRPAGCVLLRDLPSVPGAVECKRLYVAPEFRGHHLATHLMDAAEYAARSARVQWIYLDSKADFARAITLYRNRGYEEIPRFNDNAQATIFLRKRLNA